MSTDHSAISVEWDFDTMAFVWDPRTNAISAGADRLANLSEPERSQSLANLRKRVTALAEALDDGWLVTTALFMVDDLYKSSFCDAGWSSAVGQYIEASAGAVLQELTRRGYALHDVIDNTQPADRQLNTLAGADAFLRAAGLLVTGPQLMTLQLMQRDGVPIRDAATVARYRDEGHFLADRMIERCHVERLHSAYVNIDLDDDTPGLALDVALSQASNPGTIVVFRSQPPRVGSVAQIAVPPGVTLPNLDRSE
ncbi:hypothetical protein C6A87_004530 [Mycobacterium sp. ITM-2016-00317]|uniref:hypothetical protein n=1 Tax=Mycobacterium sp. ITM-2016-00317 TaxID=2099694 RepID=UPI000D45F4D1|nr:hypothetical protein [Mycobacterium sp. ITM-2016-00317]WNG88514.1 hypothetical protein C6A87_004530 [Mycobacterium sp. ITM-2016-00317]